MEVAETPLDQTDDLADEVDLGEDPPQIICETNSEEKNFESTQKLKMTDSDEKVGNNATESDQLGQTLVQPLMEIALYTATSGKSTSTCKPPKPSSSVSQNTNITAFNPMQALSGKARGHKRNLTQIPEDTAQSSHRSSRRELISSSFSSSSNASQARQNNQEEDVRDDPEPRLGRLSETGRQFGTHRTESNTK